MIKPVNDKVYTNAHPVDRVEPESVKVAGSTFDMKEYKKYESAAKKGLNIKKILPNISLKVLGEYYKIFMKRNK
jgi:hypothetical protein